VIKQARALGKRIVVVNPLHPVSPYSKNVDYLQEGDVFLQMEFKRKSSRFPVWSVSRPMMHRRGTTTRRCSDGRLNPAAPLHRSALRTR
jgi:hypothetical protein